MMTAREYVDTGSMRRLEIWQLRILMRVPLELAAFNFWLADCDDYVSAREAAQRAKYTATFAFLAFPDLREDA